MPGRVARCMDGADAGNDLAIALDEIEPVRLGERHEVVREVAAGCPLVRVRREPVLPPLDDVPRLRERWANAAVAVAHGVATGVVEVEVSIDDQCHVLGPEADVEEAVLECRRSALASVLDAV